LEAFSPEQLGLTSGGPRNPAWLYSAEMIAGDFAGMQIASLSQIRIRLDEGPGHQGEAAVVRLLARRIEERAE
ncbi:MAG TPA: SAM-dependent methyltransferase, partial [Aquimonas sp.]|nr:SAM-dependent methyltransferase [Aquimonas sp.]